MSISSLSKTSLLQRLHYIYCLHLFFRSTAGSFDRLKHQRTGRSIKFRKLAHTITNDNPQPTKRAIIFNSSVHRTI